MEIGTDLEDGSGLAVSTPSSGFHLNACSRDTAGCLETDIGTEEQPWERR